jgi:hypothetical protein
MTLDELLAALEDKSPPAPADALERFEETLGHRLPDDYRAFLISCNGGYGRGYVQFRGPTARRNVIVACLNHVGGLREEKYYSLERAYQKYQVWEVRIPKDLIWIADDPYGNGICLGVSGTSRGRVFFWDHENEPDPNRWSGVVETADNVDLLANSFQEFVSGLQKVDN